jgi:GDP/UDP-N,N'-diacetylbacillosamine 2-epimerase (hydrolysing)
MRKVCVVTSTRADYGLLRWVMEGVRTAPDLQLQVVVTGAHLSPRFGLTIREIEADGFAIDRKVDLQLDSDTAIGITHSMALALQGAGEALHELQPDVLVLLGDRYEVLAVAAAAAVSRVPIAHLHGGESTEGAFDEAMRHAITKMSHLHFVAAEPYRQRVIQLGEDPDRVFLVGGLGVDGIKRTSLLGRSALETDLDFRFQRRNLLVTFHPTTLEDSTAAVQMGELLAALEGLQDTGVIFTMPNADPDSHGLFGQIERFVAMRANSKAYTSLGHRRYLSCVAQVDGVIGNSSSGLAEVPSLHKGTINIGDRQRGRLKASSVIDCPPERQAIAKSIERLYSPAFQAQLAHAVNPYGDGGASDRIVEILRRHPLDSLLKKSFYTLPATPMRTESV